ncbi:MAG: 2-oxo-4-hydroxy-4-carboxy-5-ureidoimidazoline decarboxylase [Hyphomicrobiales bacterium]
MTEPLTLAQVNALMREEFIAQFGDIAEHSSWVAEGAVDARPFFSHDSLVDAFQQSVLTAPPSRQDALILAHPDLAGRAAKAGDLAEESRREQKGAGLDRLTEDEFKRFHQLNDLYRARFGFPFIFAVSGATKFQILDSFETRVGGTKSEERLTALAQVLRIIRFRLETRVKS